MIASPLRPRDRQEQGIAAGGQLTHPRNALRRFTLVRHHNAPMASFRHALTEAPQRQSKPHWNRPVNSEPRPCLFSVGFPLSGPQVRTSTSDLIRHALRTSPLRPTGSASNLTRQHKPNQLPAPHTEGRTEPDGTITDDRHRAAARRVAGADPRSPSRLHQLGAVPGQRAAARRQRHARRSAPGARRRGALPGDRALRRLRQIDVHALPA